MRRMIGALLVVVLAAGCGHGGGGGSRPAGGTTSEDRSVVQVDRTWTCRGPVDLDRVQITMTAASAQGPRRLADAVHLRPGCTGRIGRLDVTQYAGDGVKVAEGVHDLVVGGGSVRCLAKAPALHQDGVQVMGGDRITFRNLTIDCGRPGERLINANFFVKQAGRSTTPPTAVVCEHCSLGGDAAHTVNVQSSVRSGVTDSTFCVAKFPRLTFTVGPDAIDPVTGGNLFGACAGRRAGRPVAPGGS